MEFSIEFFTTKPAVFNPIAEISVVWIEVENYLLFLQKASNDIRHPDKWAPLGGKIHEGENHIQAAIREVKEEASVEVEANKIHFLAKFYIKDERWDFVYNMYRVCFAQRPIISISAEHQNYRWATLEEALELDLMNGVKETIEIYREKSNISYNI